MRMSASVAVTSVKLMSATAAQAAKALRMPACWPAVSGWKLLMVHSGMIAVAKPKVTAAAVPMPPGAPCGVPTAAGKFQRAESCCVVASRAWMALPGGALPPGVPPEAPPRVSPSTWPGSPQRMHMMVAS